MQKIVTEKSGLTDVRAATLVNIIYMVILIYFKTLNNIPMSTTWVFIGLLAGRELAISLSKTQVLNRRKSLHHALQLIKTDLRNSLLGLFISISLAIVANPAIRNALMSFFKSRF